MINIKHRTGSELERRILASISTICRQMGLTRDFDFYSFKDKTQKAEIRPYFLQSIGPIAYGSAINDQNAVLESVESEWNGKATQSHIDGAAAHVISRAILDRDNAYPITEGLEAYLSEQVNRLGLGDSPEASLDSLFTYNTLRDLPLDCKAFETAIKHGYALESASAYDFYLSNPTSDGFLHRVVCIGVAALLKVFEYNCADSGVVRMVSDKFSKFIRSNKHKEVIELAAERYVKSDYDTNILLHYLIELKHD